MTRRRVLLILAVVFVAIVLAVLRWREPRYAGRGLGEWLNIAYDDQIESTEREEALRAIRKIGTNALPYLLRRIVYVDSPARKKFLSTLKDLPGGSTWLEMSGGDEDRQAYPSVVGFRALGSAAAPAVPQLVALMNSTNPVVAERALKALGVTGRPAIPSLLAIVGNRSASNRANAAFWLARAYQEADALDEGIPVIRECLRDKDIAVVSFAMLALIGPRPTRPDFEVPAFIELTRHTNGNVRFRAIEGLRGFGKDARPGIKALEECLGDPESLVRWAATNALRTIAPEVLRTNNISVVH